MFYVYVMCMFCIVSTCVRFELVKTKLLLCTPELQSVVVFSAVVEARFESELKAEFDSSVREN